ncbi:hypothetical protein HAX54_016699 [Datura stramonium]|uniref:Uncharacterized protein n=1 Tax=Datura stramonium TaxID=4076 RepID=A0ABS8UJI9_DATST|nr:hypothetical protein [Datura stramonium]
MINSLCGYLHCFVWARRYGESRQPSRVVLGGSRGIHLTYCYCCILSSSEGGSLAITTTSMAPTYGRLLAIKTRNFIHGLQNLELFPTPDRPSLRSSPHLREGKKEENEKVHYGEDRKIYLEIIISKKSSEESGSRLRAQRTRAPDMLPEVERLFFKMENDRLTF